LKSLKAQFKAIKQQIVKCYGKWAIPNDSSRQPQRAPRRRYCNQPTFKMDTCALTKMLGISPDAAAAAHDPNDMTRGNENFKDFICRFKQGKINTVGCPFAKGGCSDCGDNGPGFGLAFRLGSGRSGVAGATTQPIAASNPFAALLNAHARCGSCRRS